MSTRLHWGYAKQLARINKLLEQDAKDHQSSPYESMLYVKSVDLACEGDDKTIARIVYIEDEEALMIELVDGEWES